MNIGPGAAMADVTLDIGSGQTVTLTITRHSVKRPGLTLSDEGAEIIKAAEVMVGMSKS